MPRPLLALALVIAWGIAGCGASARQKTIRATFDLTDVAAAHLVTFSHDHEMAIVHTATTEAVAVAELEDWRKKVDHAEKTIAAVYRLVAGAALVNDDKSLATLLQAAKLLGDELTELGVPK